MKKTDSSFVFDRESNESNEWSSFIRKRNPPQPRDLEEVESQ